MLWILLYGVIIHLNSFIIRFKFYREFPRSSKYFNLYFYKPLNRADQIIQIFESVPYIVLYHPKKFLHHIEIITYNI